MSHCRAGGPLFYSCVSRHPVGKNACVRAAPDVPDKNQQAVNPGSQKPEQLLIFWHSPAAMKSPVKGAVEELGARIEGP